MKNKLFVQSNQEIGEYISCALFFTSREGVVGFPPCLGVAFTHPSSLCSPTLTLGASMRVHRKHLTGHHNPNQLDQSVNYGWLFHFLTTPGWKHVNLQTLPRLQVRATAEKRVECPSDQPLSFHLQISVVVLWCRVLVFAHLFIQRHGEIKN